MLEACETRALLATVTLNSPGPITTLTLADDGTFQVRRAEFFSGQTFPSESAPGDAGLFVRTSDGVVFGPNLGAHSRTAMDPTGALALRPLELTRSPDGTTATFRADNASTPGSPQFGVSQVTTYHAGDEFFRVDTTLTNPGTTALVLDVFAAADLYLANSDKGVGYFEPVSGAVGGEDRTGTYRIFVQPETGGGQIAPTAHQEGPFRTIWQTIGSGGHFDNTVLGPVGAAPYNSDPNYIDNGAGLQWRALSLAPGGQARLSYYWSFGSQRSVKPTDPLPPAIEATALNLTATAGTSVTAAVAQFQTRGVTGPLSATIDWGDGTPSTPGQVLAGSNGSGQVQGSHTYALAGTYPVRVTLAAQGVTPVETIGQALVKAASGGGDNGGGTPVDPPPTVQGGLDPASDSGVSNSDGITNVTRPAFQGQATPGAAVALRLAPGPGTGSSTVLGQATAGPDGRWRIVPDAPLADGTHALVVQASLGGQSTTMALPTLVIDTQAPTVSALTVDPRQGRLGLSVRDAGSGLDLTSLAELAHYQFLRAVAPRPVRLALSLAGPAARAADGVATVQLRTASGRIGHGWRYQLWVRSDAQGGLRDLAGNALDGEYRGRLPSGDGRPGGDFGIGLPTDGRKVLPFRALPAGPGVVWPRNTR